MPRYLLSTQSVVDIAKKIGRPPQRWFETAANRGIDRSHVFISAVTPMILRTTFEADAKNNPDVATKAANAAVRRNTDEFIHRLVNIGSIVPVSKEIADRWGELLEYDLTYETFDGRHKEYRFHEKVVLATAIVGTGSTPFTLVEKRNAALDALAALGLLVEDPYELSYEEPGP
jgi:hypothetical protein